MLSFRYRQDEEEYEARSIRDGPQLACQLSMDMPARLEILMDAPAPTYEVQADHAWNSDDRSLNIIIKEKDIFTFHR